MKKRTKIILFSGIGLAAILILVFAVKFYYQNLRGIWFAIGKSPADVAELMSNGDSVLKLPAGFSASVFAGNLPGARVMIFDSAGNMWVSETGQGKVVKIEIKNGIYSAAKEIFTGLKNPHGLAFDPQNSNVLYIAEETRIAKSVLSDSGPGALQTIVDLPKGGNHFTRTLGFGPDGRLYVSIGSTCNVCMESDERYASIYSLKKDGTDFRQMAKGLRNSVFFIWNKSDGKMWATEMGRDLLGDNIPPDEINIINTADTSTANYGWPICYGKNIHDTEFDKNIYIRNPCMEPFTLPSHIDLQAHSAPLGLSFVPDSAGWPKEYGNNLIVAFHGSWNRSIPTGYKVARLILDNYGALVRQDDFITGWLTPNGALGRPVDVIFDNMGGMYISDDKVGVIYKVQYNK